MIRKILLLLAGGLITMLLAWAALTAVRLLNSNSASSIGLSGVLDAGRVNPGSGKKTEGISITFDPAPELPPQAADLIGTVTSIQDNSIFVVMTTKGSDSTSPPQEVVVVKETQLYRDATLDNQPPPSQSEHLQQVVQSTTLSQVSPQNVVEVWGQKRGERWTADVIVVHDR
jgi:hypothetical protein